MARIKKSDQSYIIVKARSTKIAPTRVFDGKTFYWIGGYKGLPAAKKAAAKCVRQHNMVRIVDIGKAVLSGRKYVRFIIYERSIPYAVYSKW